MSLNWCKPSRSLSNPFEPWHKHSLGSLWETRWRSNAGRVHLRPREVTLRGRGPLRRTRAFLLWLTGPLLSSVTPTCHLSNRPRSALERDASSWDRPPFRSLVAYRGATEISITAFCPETRLLGGGGEGLSQEYYRTTSGSDKPPVTASRDLTRPSPLPTWGWVLSLAAAERAL